MSAIVLIRHAAVTILPDVPAEEWGLSAHGQAAAQRLAQHPALREVSAIYTSSEPKARATATPLAALHGLTIRQRTALRELDRGTTFQPTPEAYRAAVAAAFARPDQPANGWETARHAQRRIVAAVRRIAATHSAPVAIVSHGLVLSLLVAWLEHAPPDLGRWATLPMPAIARIDRRWLIATRSPALTRVHFSAF